MCTDLLRTHTHKQSPLSLSPSAIAARVCPVCRPRRRRAKVLSHTHASPPVPSFWMACTHTHTQNNRAHRAKGTIPPPSNVRALRLHLHYVQNTSLTTGQRAHMRPYRVCVCATHVARVRISNKCTTTVPVAYVMRAIVWPAVHRVHVQNNACPCTRNTGTDSFVSVV